MNIIWRGSHLAVSFLLQIFSRVLLREKFCRGAFAPRKRSSFLDFWPSSFSVVHFEVIVLARRTRKVIMGSTQDLAELLRITSRRVNQLAGSGVLTRNEENQYDLPSNIDAYFQYKYASNEDVDYGREKAKHEAAKRQLAELELAKRNNEVHEGKDVEIIMTDMLTNLRSQLLGIPAKLAPVLAGQDESTIMQALTDEIQSRLTELSDYRPDMFAERDADDEKEDN